MKSIKDILLLVLSAHVFVLVTSILAHLVGGYDFWWVWNTGEMFLRVIYFLIFLSWSMFLLRLPFILAGVALVLAWRLIKLIILRIFPSPISETSTE